MEENNQEALAAIINKESIRLATKSEQQTAANCFIADILEGERHPLEVIIWIKGLMESFNLTLKDDRVKDVILSEIDKNGGKEVTAFGVKFTQKEMGVSYDFSVCQDPEYNRLAAEMEALKAKMKEREKYLMGIPAEGIPMVDQETGDCYKVIRPLRRASLGYSVTFKK